jgi:hypothetical protein
MRCDVVREASAVEDVDDDDREGGGGHGREQQLTGHRQRSPVRQGRKDLEDLPVDLQQQHYTIFVQRFARTTP